MFVIQIYMKKENVKHGSQDITGHIVCSALGSVEFEKWRPFTPYSDNQEGLPVISLIMDKMSCSVWVNPDVRKDGYRSMHMAC